MQISFSNKRAKNLIVGVFEGGKIPAILDKAVKASGKFKGKKDDVLTVYAVDGYDSMRLMGLGKEKEATPEDWQTFGRNAFAIANSAELSDVALDFRAKGECLTRLAFGALLATYRFDRYLTDDAKKNKVHVKTLNVVGARPKDWATYEAIAAGTETTRDLANEPSNVMVPGEFVKRLDPLKKLGVKVTVLDAKALGAKGLNLILAVGRGSVNPPYLAVMEYNGGAGAPLALIGKGICFDSGGISIKRSGGMHEMRYDMTGAATVVGAIEALARMKAKVNVVAVVGLAENMPSGSATRPGDVVKSYRGPTVEIQNTDAEGRLVLADALAYAQKNYKPKAMVDVATLTGAIMISLGQNWRAGLFSASPKLVKALKAAEDKTAERVWEMPMDDHYDELLKSTVADVNNISPGRWGGSITAAKFLQRFVDTKGAEWAHLDIAGMDNNDKPSQGDVAGATGWGVHLLVRLALDMK